VSVVLFVSLLLDVEAGVKVEGTVTGTGTGGVTGREVGGGVGEMDAVETVGIEAILEGKEDGGEDDLVGCTETEAGSFTVVSLVTGGAIFVVEDVDVVDSETKAALGIATLNVFSASASADVPTESRTSDV